MVERVREEVDEAATKETQSFPRFIFNQLRTERTLRVAEKVGALIILRKWVWKVDELPCAKESAGPYFDYVAQAVCNGQKNLKLSEGSKKFLPGFEKEISGVEEIPKKDPILGIFNHWSDDGDDDGPLWGMWQHFLASEIISGAREAVKKDGKEVSQEVGWIMQDSLEVPLKIPKTNIRYQTGWEAPASKFILTDLISPAFDLITVTAPFKLIRGRQEHFVPVSIFRRLRNGGVVGLYPEAKPSRELAPAWEGSGKLVSMIAEKNPRTQILPVGVYTEGKNQETKLFLRFGKPFPVSRCENLKPGLIGRGMMAEIAQLLPEKYRGYYKNSHRYFSVA